MNTVLVHIGCTGPHISSTEPPEYLEHCITQYLLFNNIPLYVLTDRVNVPLLKKRSGVFPVALEDYHSDKVEQFHKVFNYGPKEFWTVSTTRLIYLENFLKANQMSEIVHFENDVLVYFDIEQYAPTFAKLYPELAVTPCDPDHCTSGFMYIAHPEALAQMTAFFVKQLTKHGISGAEKQFGVYMINDMTLMRAYANASGKVGMLPVIPAHLEAPGVGDFPGIFDAAGWGQYVCGTQTDGPGITYAGHIVGGLLRTHPSYSVYWGAENKPYLDYDGKYLPFNSLHVHSKKMRPYMSQ